MNEDLPDVSKEEKALEILKKKWYNSTDSIPKPVMNEIQDLSSTIYKSHNYHFVGKVGSFCPIKKGKGGGLLLREKDGKYYSATGSKGYRWMEAEIVKTLGKQDDIDLDYFRTLVDEAVFTINKYGDFEWFGSDEVDKAPWESECPKDCNCYECVEWVTTNPGPYTCKRGFDCMPF
jgi:hypothetical protein